MKDICFDVEMDADAAQKVREWLELPIGKPFIEYIQREACRHHDGVVNALTDNPIKDILVSQREVAAEQALLALLSKIEDEVSLGRNS